MKLYKEIIEEKLNDLTQWSLSEGMLSRIFVFSDFNEAFDFMKKVAKIAEELNHHPNWHNVYNQVTINLWTHDVDSITQIDFDMASKIDEVLI